MAELAPCSKVLAELSPSMFDTAFWMLLVYVVRKETRSCAAVSKLGSLAWSRFVVRGVGLSKEVKEDGVSHCRKGFDGIVR